MTFSNASTTSHNNHSHRNNNNTKQQRPLSTYTSLGSPIGQLRKLSIIGGGGGVNNTGGSGTPIVLQSTVSPTLQSINRPRSNSLHIPSRSSSVDDSESKYGNLLQTKRKFLELYDSGIHHDSGSIHVSSDPRHNHHHHHNRKNAIEIALVSERNRIIELEQSELDMTKEELHQALKKERERTCTIQSDLASTRYTNQCLQHQQQQLDHYHNRHHLPFQQEEVLKEEHINGLVQHLDILQDEKCRIANELQREEEMLKVLQSKLHQIRQQKSALEAQIENEVKDNTANVI